MVEERHDVRVLEVRDRVRLDAEEPRARVVALSRARPDRLERDEPRELQVLRLEHDAEAAAPELPHELEAARDDVARRVA